MSSKDLQTRESGKSNSYIMIEIGLVLTVWREVTHKFDISFATPHLPSSHLILMH